MSRIVAGLTILLAASQAAAQLPQPGEAIRLSLQPAALTPGGKYHLLPHFRDQTPGNAAVQYYRAGAMLFEGDLLQEVQSPDWSNWLALPLAELPRKEAGDKLNRVERLLHEVDLGVRCRDCDWSISSRPEGYGLLLPEAQGYRNVALALAVRARYAMARGRLDEALYSLQTGYALGRHFNEGPSLIHMLIGAAMVNNIMNNQLDLFLQQPGAPNLYWALTTLPRPFFNPQNGLREESVMLENMLPALKRIEDGPMSLAQVREFQHDLEEVKTRLGIRGGDALRPFTQFAYQASIYPQAKQALREDGFTAQQVEAMPSLQVVTLYVWRDYRRSWEDYIQWTCVPNFTREPGFKQAYQKCDNAGIRLGRVFFGWSGNDQELTLAPRLEKIYDAAYRTDRRFAALRCVEAVRLYAAAHDGNLPSVLKDVADVPVSDDPLTGKPFTYEVKGDTAFLASPVVDGEQHYQKVKYELTIRR